MDNNLKGAKMFIGAFSKSSQAMNLQSDLNSKHDASRSTGSQEVLLDKIITKLEQASLAVAAVCAVIVMLVASYDAVSRYLFNAPLSWAFEFITYYMLVVIPYFALSATYTNGDHLNFNLIQNKLPKKLRAFFDFLTALLTATVFSIIAYGAWEHVVMAYQSNEFIPGVIMWPVWLSYLPVFLGATVFVLRLLCQAVLIVIKGSDYTIGRKTGSSE